MRLDSVAPRGLKFTTSDIVTIRVHEGFGASSDLKKFETIPLHARTCKLCVCVAGARLMTSAQPVVSIDPSPTCVGHTVQIGPTCMHG